MGNTLGKEWEIILDFESIIDTLEVNCMHLEALDYKGLDSEILKLD